MTSLGNFILEYEKGKSDWLKIAREMDDAQLLQTAKEITDRTLIYHRKNGKEYSALSCPVHSACSEELMRRQSLGYRKLMRLEVKGLKKRGRKRKNRQKKIS